MGNVGDHMLVIAIVCFLFFALESSDFLGIPTFFGGDSFASCPVGTVLLASAKVWHAAVGRECWRPDETPLQTNLWLLTMCIGLCKCCFEYSTSTSKHSLICHQLCHKWVLWRDNCDPMNCWCYDLSMGQTKERTQWWSSIAAGWHGVHKDSARWTHHWCHRCLPIPPASHYFGRWSCVWKGHQWTSLAGFGRYCGQCKPKHGSASPSALAIVSFFVHTPPKFNIAPEKRWLEDEFPFGIAYF